MSDNSRSDSNSSQKSRFGHLQGAKIRPGDASEMLRKSLRNISDKTRNVSAALQSNLQNAINSKKDSSVYSKASRELDEFGYEKFNIDDEVEIFISKVPERALFNDGEPVIVRANDQGFIGTSVAAPKVAQVQMDEPEPQTDVHALFSNVQTGHSCDGVIAGCTGEVVNGEVKPVVDSTFLNKISNSHAEARPEVPAAEDEPAEIMRVPAPEDEEINIVKFEEDSDIVILDPADFETPAEAPVTADEEAIEEDDSWMYESDPEAEECLREHEAMYGEGSFEGIFDDAPVSADEPAEIMSVPAPVAEAAVAAAEAEDEPAEIMSVPAPVKEEVAEAPVAEEPVKEEVVAEIPTFREEPAEIMSVPAPVKEEVVAEAPVAEEPAEIMSVPAPEPVTEEPAAEVVVASVPTFREAPAEPQVQEVEGLYTEAKEAISAAATIDEVATAAQAPMAVTSSAAVVNNATAIRGMDEEGANILPRMTEPVKRRPSSMRFRFHNGVLQNIDDKKDESEEGLRGPFDGTVGQTVSQETDIDRLPPIEIDDETDLMKLTVPELDVDEDSFTVGFSGDSIPYDGMEVLEFRPAPVRPVEIEDEVGDIMMMTVPGLDCPATGFWEYAEIPDDGMEAVCFEPEPELDPVYDPAIVGIGVGFAAIAAAAVVERISAPARIHALPAAEAVRQISAPAEPVMLSEPEYEPIVEEAEPIPAEIPEIPSYGVTFGFGNGDGQGSVCFSF